MQQLHKPWSGFLMNMRQVTIQNNLDPVYTWFKSIYINLKWLLGENWLLLKSYLFTFLIEKK